MSYLVEWHIPKKKVDRSVLKSLPPELRVYVYRIDECKYDLIYAHFGAQKFFPHHFDNKHEILNELHDALTKAGVDVSFNPQLINLNLWLSRALQDEVISIESDDDLRDMAVQSSCGSLSRMHFRAEDIEVLVENDEIHIFPLIMETFDVADEGPIVDLTHFHKDSFVIHAREKEHTSYVHEIAAKEISSFLGMAPETIGLTTGHLDDERLQLVFSRKIKQRVAPARGNKLSLRTRFIVLMLTAFAVLGGHGYMTSTEAGHLDALWLITAGVTIAVVIGVFSFFEKRP